MVGLTAFTTAADLASAAAGAIETALRDALAVRGHASLVGTGGRSPGAIYDRLAQADLDWSRVTVTLSDERCVPSDDIQSNAALMRERLLTGCAAAAPFLPLWPPPDPAALAALIPFDAVMLGMGEDGHIASLIPGDPGLEAALGGAQLTHMTPAGLGRPPLSRISLTLGAITRSRAVFLSFAGEAKRAVFARAIAGEDLPVARLLNLVPVYVFWTSEA